MTDTDAPKLLSVDDLSIAFDTPSGPLAAIRQVSMLLESGARTALVGESGSGKSTLALSILGLLPPSARVIGGSVSLGDQRLDWDDDRAMSRIRGRRIGFIYQDPMAAFDPIRTIGEHLLEAIRLHFPSIANRQARQRAVTLLEEVEIRNAAERLDDYPHQYSGGMRQRVMIAAALAGDPDLIVADEPTTALDVTTQAAILGLFDRIVEARGTAILL
ncbi:MAG: ABC transporter ATP-binding protein, partial [Hyphomicrobiales bacterium]|nr:ABC transporter ATP-binding protein [Hyphomicrobiales bacterium]